MLFSKSVAGQVSHRNRNVIQTSKSKRCQNHTPLALRNRRAFKFCISDNAHDCPFLGRKLFCLCLVSCRFLFGEPDQLSSDPLKPEDVDLQHFQVIEPHLSSATDLDGKTGRKSIDIMIETQTTKEQDTQTRRDQEKDSEHHATQTDSSTSDGDAKTKRSSFDIKTKPSEGQSTKTGSEEDKDSQRPLQFQTDETRPESFEFVSPTHEKQETEEHMDTSGDYVQITGKPC